MFKKNLNDISCSVYGFTSINSIVKIISALLSSNQPHNPYLWAKEASSFLFWVLYLNKNPHFGKLYLDQINIIRTLLCSSKSTCSIYAEESVF